jgi:hypothetical protein
MRKITDAKLSELEKLSGAATITWRAPRLFDEVEPGRWCEVGTDGPVLDETEITAYCDGALAILVKRFAKI